MRSMTIRVGARLCAPVLVLTVGCGGGGGGGDVDGGGTDAADDSCPSSNPIGEPCADDGATCAYGYDPAECGGITVECDGGEWVERSHTDPSPSCFDAGASDAGVGDAAPSDAGTIRCPDAGTCAPDEVCFIQCLCCGVDGGGPPDSRSECRDIPDGCTAEDICDCPDYAGDWCDEEQRRIERPCA